MSDYANENQTCPTVAYQLSSICVPVTVTPFAKAGMTMTKCCSRPTVTPGRELCNGVKGGQCVFYFSQDICVEVPVEFGAVAQVGDTYVACNGASADDICPACGTHDATFVETPAVGDTVNAATDEVKTAM